MRTVRQLLAAKAPEIHAIGPDAAVIDAIRLMAESDGKRDLLLAATPAGPILAALARLGPGPHRFDAVKMSHHGSRRNTNLELAREVQSRRWLLSTNGAQFGHPDPMALARGGVVRMLGALVRGH